MRGGAITRAYAKGFDAERKALGPQGDLTLLTLTGKSPEGVSAFSSIATFSSGWKAQASRGADGAAYTKLEVADVDEEMRGLIDRASDANDVTHFAAGGLVYRIEPDQTLRPVTEPRVWELRGYETGQTYG